MTDRAGSYLQLVAKLGGGAPMRPDDLVNFGFFRHAASITHL